MQNTLSRHTELYIYTEINELYGYDLLYADISLSIVVYFYLLTNRGNRYLMDKNPFFHLLNETICFGVFHVWVEVKLPTNLSNQLRNWMPFAPY